MRDAERTHKERIHQACSRLSRRERAHVRSSATTIRRTALVVETQFALFIAVSETDKLRKPHRNTSGTGSAKALPTLLFPKPKARLCTLVATIRTWQIHLGRGRPSTH